MGAVAVQTGCMSEDESKQIEQTGWVSVGRCPVDANMVHLAMSYTTRREEDGDPVRVEVMQGSTPLAGMVVTPNEFSRGVTVDHDHGCGVPATRVGPGESPLAVDNG